MIEIHGFCDPRVSEVWWPTTAEPIESELGLRLMAENPGGSF